MDDTDQSLTAKDAAELLGVSRGLVELWASAGCPFLPEKKPLRRYTNPHSRKGVRYDAAEIAVVRKEREARQHQRGSATGYLNAAEAWKRFRFKQAWLYDWHNKPCCFLDGVRLGAQREMRGVANDNGCRVIWVYRLDQLEQIAEARERERRGVFRDAQGTWLSAKAAKKIYGIWDASLGSWQSRRCPFLGRPIAHKPMRRLSTGRGCCKRMVYAEADLQAINNAQNTLQPATFRDADGVWLFASEVAKRTGWPQDGLWYYRNKKWPELAAGRLRAKRVAGEHHPNVRVGRVAEFWVYHEADLARLTEGQAIAVPPALAATTADNKPPSPIEGAAPSVPASQTPSATESLSPFVAASTLARHVGTYKQFSSFLKKHPEIPTQKPSRNRLEVHAAAFHRALQGERNAAFAAGDIDINPELAGSFRDEAVQRGSRRK